MSIQSREYRREYHQRPYVKVAKQKHWEQNRERYMRLRAELQSLVEVIKLERGCERCGYKKNSAALDYHHEDPHKKLFSLNTARSRKRAKVLAEIAKCKVLCRNCHSEITHPHKEAK